jgi:hypothetical protein
MAILLLLLVVVNFSAGSIFSIRAYNFDQVNQVKSMTEKPVYHVTPETMMVLKKDMAAAASTTVATMTKPEKIRSSTPEPPLQTLIYKEFMLNDAIVMPPGLEGLEVTIVTPTPSAFYYKPIELIDSFAPQIDGQALDLENMAPTKNTRMDDSDAEKAEKMMESEYYEDEADDEPYSDYETATEASIDLYVSPTRYPTTTTTTTTLAPYKRKPASYNANDIPKAPVKNSYDSYGSPKSPVIQNSNNFYKPKYTTTTTTAKPKRTPRPTFLQKLVDGEYMPFNDPVANWLASFTMAGVFFQAVATPYGQVTVTGGKRRKRDAAADAEIINLVAGR